MATRPRHGAAVKESTKIPPRAASRARSLAPRRSFHIPNHHTPKTGARHLTTLGNSDKVSGLHQNPYVQPPRHHQQAISRSVPPELRHRVRRTVLRDKGVVPNGGNVTLHQASPANRMCIRGARRAAHCADPYQPCKPARTTAKLTPRSWPVRPMHTSGRRPVATKTATAPMRRSNSQSSPGRSVGMMKSAHAESRSCAADRARPSKQAVSSRNQKRM